jgi:hypothetical protein
MSLMCILLAAEQALLDPVALLHEVPIAGHSPLGAQ